ncbi:MAG TPA: zinc ribbon domain-containing protein, partial [Candidatus Scatosoma pullistercoris]|nr:zinc ribbon domain-containing protein [Candidatus Scatosoma pullistercoris]
MKTCPRCAFENKDGAKFCVKCGQALDKHCPKCDSVVEPDELYCHVCGTRLDGKRVCPACNAANEPDSAFCENCGTPLNLSGPAAVWPKPVQKKSASGKRIFDIVRASVALAFSLIMFISCFFSVGKISPSATFDVFDIEEVGHIKITSVDVIEGAFSLLDPMSDREFFSDFTSFALEHLSSKEQELLENGSPAQQTQVMIKLLEDYNVLKVFSLEEVTKYSASVKAELWIAAVLSLGYILLCTAFLILSVIDFVFVLSGKKRIRATLKLNVVLLAILLSLNFFLKMVFSPNWKDMAPGISMVLIFGILFIGLEIAGRIVSGELRFSKKQLASYISAGVGAVIALVVLSLAAGSIVTVRCSVSSLTESFKGGYSASALSKGWDALLQANENPDIFGQAETTILT